MDRKEERNLNVKVSEEIRRSLKAEAARKGSLLRDFVAEILEKYCIDNKLF